MISRHDATTSTATRTYKPDSTRGIYRAFHNRQACVAAPSPNNTKPASAAVPFTSRSTRAARLHLPDAEHLQVMGITKQIHRDKTYDDTHRKQHRVAKPPQGASECKRCTDRLEKAVKSSSQQNVTVQHDQLSQDADTKLPLMSQDVTRSGSGITRNDKVIA